MILNPVRRYHNRVAREITAATIDFATTSYDGMTTLAASFTCQEAESFAAMLRAMGYPPKWPDQFMDAHAAGDDDPEDAHHERHLQNQADAQEARHTRGAR